MDDLLTQLQTGLTTLLAAAGTAFIAWLFTALRTHFGLSAADSAELAVRKAAATEAGVIASTIPATISTSTASPASLMPPGTIAAAASKVITDLPAEIKLTGYTPNDIGDMILSNLPGLLGLINPALGAAAGAVAGVVRAAGAK
jgi:hypothetical protein